MRYRTRAGRLRTGPLALIAAAATAAGVMPFVAPVANAAVACTVNYQVTNQWQGGFGASVSIRNEGDAVNNWRLTWTFPDGQRVQSGWNGTFTQSGAGVTVAAPGWAPNLGTGATVTPGFNGSWTGQNRPPTDFALNGTRCTGPNVNADPTASLTSPVSGTAFQVGQAIPMAATAADTDGTIAKVDFLADGVVVATDTSSPYNGSWTGATAGEHTLVARATDDKGGVGASTAVGVRVIAGQAVQVSPPSLSVRQGGTNTFGVSLATAPTSSVTVAVARSAGSTDLTAGPASLTFTTANWATKQNVTVTSAANGGDLASATFTASATGATAATVEVKEISDSASDFEQAFLDQYAKINDPASGYYRTFPDGLKVPYHSIETLMVEAPDHGHQTTSEAFSYYLWLEASYGKIVGDWAPFKKAWASMEKYIIPAKADQPTNDKYDASKPATYAPEHPRMDQYPSVLDSGVSVGRDPIAAELRSAYGNSDIYGMHWLLDVDNTYGFGRCGDESDALPAYINTYQRGSSESVWETIPQPSCDTFAHGGPNGFLDLFTKDASYAKQWKYTNAPDADARAVQVAMLAQEWATEQGKGAEVAPELEKAAKMGDYLRYAMFDKYFKKIGNCASTSCPAGTGKDSAHYLMSWYYAWGGATDTSAGWAWRIGDGASHQGYQNPLAAYALANVPALKPKSATGQQDWATSMTRQLEMLQWLQSADGAIAGGVTNSWEGSYSAPPAGTPTFYGMYYDAHPVWRDPPSNRWFGFQAWQMERTAALYEKTGNAAAKKILDKWVPWAIANTTVGTGGQFQIPNDLTWTGAPDNWNATNPGANANLRVTVANHSQDVGIAASYAKTLLNYAAESGNAQAKTVGEGLLTALLAHQDSKGIAVPETRADYNRFDDTYNTSTREGPYVPTGWSGTMPNGDQIRPGVSFVDMRSMFKQDPEWPKVQSYLNGGPVPTFTYHRFWAQAEIATAFQLHVELFG